MLFSLELMINQLGWLDGTRLGMLLNLLMIYRWVSSTRSCYGPPSQRIFIRKFLIVILKFQPFLSLFANFIKSTKKAALSRRKKNCGDADKSSWMLHFYEDVQSMMIEVDQRPTRIQGNEINTTPTLPLKISVKSGFFDRFFFWMFNLLAGALACWSHVYISV